MRKILIVLILLSVITIVYNQHLKEKKIIKQPYNQFIYIYTLAMYMYVSVERCTYIMFIIKKSLNSIIIGRRENTHEGEKKKKTKNERMRRRDNDERG